MINTLFNKFHMLLKTFSLKQHVGKLQFSISQIFFPETLVLDLDRVSLQAEKTSFPCKEFIDLSEFRVNNVAYNVKICDLIT